MLSPDPLHVFGDHEGEVYSVAFGYGDALVAAGNDQGLVRVYDVASRELSRLRTAHKGSPVYGMDFWRDKPLLITCANDGVRLGYVVGESWVPDLPNKAGRGHLCAAVHPAVTHFASGGFAGMITIYDIMTGEVTHNFRAHAKATSRLAFSPDGTTLLSSGYDGKVCGWDPYSGQPKFSLDAHAGECYSVECTPDGARFVTCGKDNLVKVWDAKTQQPAEVGQTPSAPSRARIHPNGDWIGVPCEDGSVVTFSLKEPGKPVGTVKAHQGTAYDLAFARNGTLAVTAGGDKSAKLWHVG